MGFKNRPKTNPTHTLNVIKAYGVISSHIDIKCERTDVRFGIQLATMQNKKESRVEMKTLKLNMP